MNTGEHHDVAKNLRSLVGSLSRAVSRPGTLSSGDISSLRRMEPRQPAPAFFKLEGLLLDEYLPGDAALRLDQETRWAAIVVGLAHLQELQRVDARLGHVLADAGFSDVRFVRLVRADADRLVDELPTLARYLATKGRAVDWTTAALLILSAGRRDEENVRRHLARDYYGALARSDRH